MFLTKYSPLINDNDDDDDDDDNDKEERKGGRGEIMNVPQATRNKFD